MIVGCEKIGTVRKGICIFNRNERIMFKNSIPMWSEDDRPREKLMTKGKSTLSDAELIAILIGTGTTGNKSAVDLARELLGLVGGDLYEFGKLSLEQLRLVKGIGESKAVTILAALELGRRRKEKQAEKKPRILSSRHTYEMISPYYADLEHEEFHIILINRASEVLGIRQVSLGGMAGTYVDPKIIFKTAINIGASGLILTHNHPSGNCSPSYNDEQLTRKISQFGAMIEMPVMDHIIVTDNGYFSFSDNSLL